MSVVTSRKKVIASFRGSSLITLKLPSSSLLTIGDRGARSAYGRAVIAAEDIHAELRLGRYGARSASSSRLRLSDRNARSMPERSLGRWRSIAQKPPNEIGDWTAEASPTLRMRSKAGERGAFRLYVGNHPNTTRDTLS